MSELEDREAIKQLIATYTVLGDRGRVNEMAWIFAEDARLPDTPERAEEVRRSKIPMKRRGTADEIAKAILFMSSDLASYITGQNLMVDGGWTAANLKNSPDWGGP